MLNLNELHSSDLMKLLAIKKKIDVLELELAKALKKAAIRLPQLTVTVRKMKMSRSSQPSVRALISGILQKADAPMTVSEIYEASLKTGYQWRSQEPINALNVKLYTDKTFKKIAPGKFVMRKKS
jgi:hypothetical protein